MAGNCCQDIEFHIITKDNGFNGLVSHIKKSGRICLKVTKKTEEILPAPKLSPCAELTVERLSKIDGRKRPRKEQQLANWIESHCRSISKNVNAKSVLGELVKAGMINKDTPVIKYKLER